MFVPVTDEAAWLSSLNPSQRAAVLHGDGPLLVIAGAGSGKTKTLAARVARLIADGADPDRVLLLTFTRRAAAEMLRRASALLDGAGTSRVWGGTFHGIANRLLRRHAEAVGLAPTFTVMDQADAASLFGLVRADLGYGTGKVRFPRQETIAAIYSRVVNAQTKLGDTLDERFPWCKDHVDDLKAIFREYTIRKRRHDVVDYDDLLLYWRALLQSPSGASVAARFDHVLVDEYQDTNRTQAEILELLCGTSRNLTVVGDDAQSIYSFRAASVDHILGFPDAFPGATVVTLEQNYRSSPQILAAANDVIAGSPAQYPKRLWSDRPDGPVPRLVICTDPAGEADHVCDRILELREQGYRLRDQAVLFRTGHHSDALELELSRRRIPFVKFGGLKFLEAAHVKDLMAMLRVADNPRDELAWHRVLQLVPGIGPATARSVMARLGDASAGDGTDALAAFTRLEIPVGAEAKAPMRELQEAFADVRAGSGASAAVDVERFLPFCSMVFEHRYDDATARLGDLTQLRDLAGAHADRSRFLTDLVLDPPTSTSELAGPPHLDDDYLVLSTIHSAKGGEWRAVFVIHAADGNIPSDMALSEPGGVDEERRIFYVALTRAREHLTVSVPQRFYHRAFVGSAKHSYALPSRFIDAAAARFERVAAVDDVPGDAPAATSGDPVAPVLDALWE